MQKYLQDLDWLKPIDIERVKQQYLINIHSKGGRNQYIERFDSNHKFVAAIIIYGINVYILVSFIGTRER